MERINSQTILAKRRSKQRKQKLVRGLAIVLALMVIWKFFGSAVTWIRQWQSDEVYAVSDDDDEDDNLDKPDLDPEDDEDGDTDVADEDDEDDED
jgi:hypothetical protein